MTDPGLPAPASEITITTEVLRALLRQQHPDLASLPLRVVAEGWDNVLIRIGEDLVARLPRRSQAVPLVAHEHRWLPELAARLPVPIPAPVRIGRSGPGFPWPWSITRWLEGATAAERPVDAARGWAPELARALSSLHHTAPVLAPHNPFRGVPLVERDAAVSERLARLPRVGVAAEVWRRAVDAPAWPGPPLWVHGDLHPGNLLVRTGEGTGTAPDSLDAILDFGDLSAGDPATDLAAAWLVFDDAGRAAFVTAYRAASPSGSSAGLMDRARGWALAMAAAILAVAPGDRVNLRWATRAYQELTSVGDR